MWGTVGLGFQGLAGPVRLTWLLSVKVKAATSRVLDRGRCQLQGPLVQSPWVPEWE